MQLFNNKTFKGTLYYFDLDVIIWGNLDWMLNLDPKRFWAIRNQKYWTGLDNLEKFREHLDGKYNAPSDLFEYKEQKESEAV